MFGLSTTYDIGVLAVCSQDVFGDETEIGVVREAPEVGEVTAPKRKRVPRFQEVEEPEAVPAPPPEIPAMLTKMQV